MKEKFRKMMEKLYYKILNYQKKLEREIQRKEKVKAKNNKQKAKNNKKTNNKSKKKK